MTALEIMHELINRDEDLKLLKLFDEALLEEFQELCSILYYDFADELYDQGILKDGE